MLALFVGLTVAQPFGVLASEEEDGAPRPPTPAEPPNQLEPQQTNGEDVHVARLFGIPVLPFRFYNRNRIWYGENTPMKTLRVRSWFWLPLLTNATEVAETCSDVFIPCWEPGFPDGNDLTVFREDGTQWATIDNPPGRGTAQVPDSFTWKLSAGIASPAGLAYWVLAAALIVTARRRRARATGSHPTETAATHPPAPFP